MELGTPRLDDPIAIMRDEIAWLRGLLERTIVGPVGDGSVSAGPCPAVDVYLDLMKKCLTRLLFDTDHASSRAVGKGRPAEAETMIGLRRLDNIQECITDVLRRGVPGDLIETGVWRGGATIFMRAILAAYGDTKRTVWVADSFQGVPPPDGAKYPLDAKSRLYEDKTLAIPVEEVKANFSRYGLLDDQVRFLVGWFRDTLPKAPVKQLAVARLDGDLYESTLDALAVLYPKLSVGGYLIVDDYCSIRGTKMAVDDYRDEHGIDEPIVVIDWAGAYWQRQR
jgi:O-methyltransferase